MNGRADKQTNKLRVRKAQPSSQQLAADTARLLLAGLTYQLEYAGATWRQTLNNQVSLLLPKLAPRTDNNDDDDDDTDKRGRPSQSGELVPLGLRPLAGWRQFD